MSSTNGILSPPSTRHFASKSAPTQGKRKRTESHDPPQTNGITVHTQSGHTRLNSLEQFQTDFLVVAQRIDSSLSIINHPFTPSKDSSTEPDTKRSKRTDSNNLVSKLQSKAYQSFDDIKSDITASSSQLVESVSPSRLPANAANQTQSSALTLEDRTIIKDIIRATRELLLFVEREQAKLKSKERIDTENDELTEGNLPNGDAGSVETKPLSNNVTKTSLTALANSGSSLKQVFSSFRDPLSESKELHNIGGPSIASTDAIEEKFPLRESALRSGLWQTDIDQPRIQTESKKEYLSFGKIFGMHKGLPELALPKQSKATTTRKNTIGFVHPLDQRLLVDLENDPLSYPYEPLQTGHWLSYNNISAVAQPTSSETKQRQRARTLSTGDAKAAIPREAILAHNKAKEDALFRSVYTSFAPSKDESAAIVPESLVSRIWWDRIGRPEQPLEFESVDEATANEELLDETAFEDMISAWKPEELKLDAKVDRENIEQKDVDEVLDDISELLETLNAYQTSRNLPLPKSRSALGHSQQISEMTGSPTTPSNAEFDIYTILKSQLAILISNLPPYAVAKLNGDQLADLNVSGILRARRENCTGTMDPNLPGPKRIADLPVATTPRAPTISSGRSQYTSQYRGQPPNIPRSAQAMPSHYTAMPHQSPVRPPQNLPRSLGAGMSTSVGYPLNRGLSNPNQRAMQTFPTTPSYGQVNGTRPVYDASTSSSARYFQNSGPTYASNVTNRLSAARQSSQPNYQPQAPVHAARPQAYSTPYATTPQAARSASPLKQPQATPSYNPQSQRPMTPLQHGQQASQQGYYQSPTAGNPKSLNVTSPPSTDAARQANQMTQMAHMVTLAQQQILTQQQQQQAANSQSHRGSDTAWQQNAAHLTQDQTAAMARQQAQFQRSTSSTSNRSGSKGGAIQGSDGVDDGEEDELA